MHRRRRRRRRRRRGGGEDEEDPEGGGRRRSRPRRIPPAAGRRGLEVLVVDRPQIFRSTNGRHETGSTALARCGECGGGNNGQQPGKRLGVRTEAGGEEVRQGRGKEEEGGELLQGLGEGAEEGEEEEGRGEEVEIDGAGGGGDDLRKEETRVLGSYPRHHLPKT